MKTVMNLCLLALAITFSNAVNAAGKISVAINNSMVNVSLTKVTKGEKLYLKDFNGEVLFNTTLKAMPTYTKFFNLSNMPDGVYFVETEAAYDVKVTPILKNQKGVSLINNSEVTIFKPQVSIRNKFAKVLFNNTRKSPITIKIYDTDWKLLEESTTVEDALVKKTYDFSKVPEGEYIFYFNIRNREYVQKVSLH